MSDDFTKTRFNSNPINVTNSLTPSPVNEESLKLFATLQHEYCEKKYQSWISYITKKQNLNWEGFLFLCESVNRSPFPVTAEEKLHELYLEIKRT